MPITDYLNIAYWSKNKINNIQCLYTFVSIFDRWTRATV